MLATAPETWLLGSPKLVLVGQHRQQHESGHKVHSKPALHKVGSNGASSCGDTASRWWTALLSTSDSVCISTVDYQTRACTRDGCRALCVELRDAGVAGSPAGLTRSVFGLDSTDMSGTRNSRTSEWLRHGICVGTFSRFFALHPPSNAIMGWVAPFAAVQHHD